MDIYRCEVCYGDAMPIYNNILCDDCLDEIDWERIERKNKERIEHQAEHGISQGEDTFSQEELFDHQVKVLANKFPREMRAVNIIKYGPIK